MSEDYHIPDLELLLESMNGAFTTESIVTNSGGQAHSVEGEQEAETDKENYVD
jgi:hypothetical protein